jgi:glycosyltransferase involved in cell wall biosynthesis
MKSFLTSRLLRIHSQFMTATTTKTAEMHNTLPLRARRSNWIIPDGVDTSRFQPMDRAAARVRLGWPHDEPTVITVGRRSPVKRLWLAEEVAALAAREVEGLRWRAVSAIAPHSLPLYYSAADALLHPSASEGSPNVIKEAMACNLPVVATAAGDIPELLDGVQPSAVCHSARPDLLANELVRILRQGQRSNGRERIDPLRIEVETSATLACYRTLGITP